MAPVPVAARVTEPDAAQARVLLLGEMTHGTTEFYESRAEATEALAEQGPLVVALEADWPDAAAADAFVRHGSDDLSAWHSYARWPTWMWRNGPFLDMLHRLRAHNKGRDEEDQVMVCGLDLYSMSESIAAVLAYLQRKDPTLAAAARARYDCLARWEQDPASYGAAVARRLVDCRDEVVQVLVRLLERRLGEESGPDVLDPVQNARLVAGAERYYRSLYEAGTSSWNIRDEHMVETLRQVLDARGPGARAVVWAHNSHVGDARASEMGARGETTLGTLCRQWTRTWSLGQFCDHGTVTAGSTWGAVPEAFRLPMARADSSGAWLRDHLDGKGLVDAQDVPHEERLERAVGVVYRPETERVSHYFVSDLSARYDAVAWFPETRALPPLAAVAEDAPPDLWPSAK